ncbi:MAG: hypothetical protein ACRBC3_08725 [Burkholderiaceae bacterium]
MITANEFYQTDTSRAPFNLALAVSIAVHAVLMLITIAPPDPIKFKPLDSRLEVILLNAKGTREKDTKAEVIAQVDMTAGGVDEAGRAKSPLVAEQTVQEGADLDVKKKKVSELEDMQRQLMAMARSPTTFVDRPDARKSPNDPGADEEDIQFKIARLQAEIARNIEDYNKRPRRLTYGVNAVGATYARYVTDWAAQIEQIGTDRYPIEARGKYYDTLIITVELMKDGHVGDIIINKKSRYDVLNRAVKEIVLAGAPYEAFTPEMAKEGDILQVVRTWSFVKQGLQTTAAVKPDKQ